MIKLKISGQHTETSPYMTLPGDVLTRMGLKAGDEVCLTEAPGGGWRITPYSEVDANMVIIKKIMNRDHEILKALA
jgi:hypothetical protein